MKVNYNTVVCVEQIQTSKIISPDKLNAITLPFPRPVVLSGICGSSNFSFLMDIKNASRTALKLPN
jgi:hypothetical protein